MNDKEHQEYVATAMALQNAVAEIKRLRGRIQMAEAERDAANSLAKTRHAEIERLRKEVVANAGAFGKLHNIIGGLEGEIERLRGLSDITRLDVMWQELVKERYAAENNAAILAAEVQNLRSEIKQLRGLLREAPKHSMTENLRRRVREALGE